MSSSKSDSEFKNDSKIRWRRKDADLSRLYGPDEEQSENYERQPRMNNLNRNWFHFKEIPANMELPRAIINSEILAEQKMALKEVTSVTLGPTDARGKEFKKKRQIATHEFIDIATSTRREISELKNSLMMADLIKNEKIEKNGNFVDDSILIDSNRDYSKNSMDVWARRTHSALSKTSKGAVEGYIDSVARVLYDNWRHPGQEPIDRSKKHRRLSQQDGPIAQVLTALQKENKDGVSVYDQGTGFSPVEAIEKEGSYHKGRKVDPVNNFAYRINPIAKRNTSVKGKPFSRLSLNMDIEHAPEMAHRMAEMVRNNPEQVGQTKMMGPGAIGERVDDAVVYLRGKANIETARYVDKELGSNELAPKFSATPPGMKSLSGVSSYAEYMPETSSSHGFNRGKIVRNVVQQKLRLDAELDSKNKDNIERIRKGLSKNRKPNPVPAIGKLMGSALSKAGYSREEPYKIKKKFEFGPLLSGFRSFFPSRK